VFHTEIMENHAEKSNPRTDDSDEVRHAEQGRGDCSAATDREVPVTRLQVAVPLGLRADVEERRTDCQQRVVV